jgi:hypothetical protein
VNPGPNQKAVAEVATQHLGPILYALEVCAVAMDQAGRADDAKYYRSVATELADAGGTGPSADLAPGQPPQESASQ